MSAQRGNFTWRVISALAAGLRTFLKSWKSWKTPFKQRRDVAELSISLPKCSEFPTNILFFNFFINDTR